MTSMPEMVALFNGLGGAASLLVGWASVHVGWLAHGVDRAFITYRNDEADEICLFRSFSDTDEPLALPEMQRP